MMSLMAAPGSNHGIDVLIGRNANVEQIRAFGRQHAIEGGRDFLGRFDAFCLPPVCVGEFHKVGVGVKNRGRVSLVIEQLLPLMHHAERSIVHEGNLDRNAVDGGGCHFLAVHLKAAVARHADNLRIGASDLGAVAAGNPNPMVPSPPLERNVRACSRRMRWCAHIWCCPTSVVTIEASGSSF